MPFHFTGRIQRYRDISNILHLIEMTNKVKFEVKESGESSVGCGKIKRGLRIG